MQGKESFIACFLNSSSYCFPVPIDDTLLCFYYTLIVLYVSSFIIKDYLRSAILYVQRNAYQ